MTTQLLAINANQPSHSVVLGITCSISCAQALASITNIFIAFMKVAP